MSLEYLRFNIFGLALNELATSSGSLSKRLCHAYRNHLHKISWDKDYLIIPTHLQDEFEKLKTIINDEVSQTIVKERKHYRKNYKELSEELISEISNTHTVIRNLHWKKSKQAVEIISNIYFGLCMFSKSKVKPN